MTCILTLKFTSSKEGQRRHRWHFLPGSHTVTIYKCIWFKGGGLAYATHMQIPYYCHLGLPSINQIQIVSIFLEDPACPFITYTPFTPKSPVISWVRPGITLQERSRVITGSIFFFLHPFTQRPDPGQPGNSLGSFLNVKGGIIQATDINKHHAILCLSCGGTAGSFADYR